MDIINLLIVSGSIFRSLLDFLHIIFNSLFYVFLFTAIIISFFYYIISINVIFFCKQKKSYKAFDEEKAPFITIQIPTFNELAAIRCAKSCLNFDYPKNKYEIIIGDDSTEKSVSKELDQFAKKHEIVKITRRGNNIGYKSGNLNYMLKQSKGEIIVLFDSDFVPGEEFLRKIIAPFQQNKNLEAVQARWKFLNPQKNTISKLGSTIVAVFHHITLPFMNSRGGLTFLCGSAEAVKKDTLLKLGGWKSGSLTEDIDYSLRLLKNGYNIEYLPYLECAGEVPFKPSDLYKQQKRWAYGSVSSFKEHGIDILKSKHLGFQDKFWINFAWTGYFMSILLALLFLTGFLSVITHNPESWDFSKFMYELGRNVLLSSGLLFAGVVAKVKSKEIRAIPSLIRSSFTYGLLVTYHVNVGILKAFTNRYMPWFILEKEGNKTKT